MKKGIVCRLTVRRSLFIAASTHAEVSTDTDGSAYHPDRGGEVDVVPK